MDGTDRGRENSTTGEREERGEMMDK